MLLHDAFSLATSVLQRARKLVVEKIVY